HWCPFRPQCGKIMPDAAALLHGQGCFLDDDMASIFAGLQLMGIEDRIGYARVPEDPYKRWPVVFIGDEKAKAPAHRFAHGLGVGDINGDGRNDVMWKGGWFEQPEDGEKTTEPWTHHATKIVGDNCADMYVVELDGDQRNDVFSTSAHGRGVYFSKQTGDKAGPTFQTTKLDDRIYETHSLNYIDINRDGKKDLVTGRRFFAHGFHPSKAGEPSELYWYDVTPKKDAPPEVEAHLIDDQSGVGAQFVTEDINGDSRIDIVISNRKGVFVFTQE
ncbi:MAG: VCBS repeat-containing protein, partial [Verrucomicrobiota bacterium]